ncbi:hypothetical protein M7I_1814 [Glarea lozoyensis 74030]|uniref:4a-hydroxytetrahydrobiopterin dehydratase n=1 Tax=Glarea lozoyensis (strain ATCC 74030 / MF5533) TaxID=1104152 RepID=H0EGV6_GLAL7|nr:hypothetical protein M7I_1814 [Glarea lozoyensis 74030]
MTTQPIFASNYPPTEATAALAPLLKPTGKWSLTPNGQGIERPFKFKGFKKCWFKQLYVKSRCPSYA